MAIRWDQELRKWWVRCAYCDLREEYGGDASESMAQSYFGFDLGWRLPEPPAMYPCICRKCSQNRTPGPPTAPPEDIEEFVSWVGDELKQVAQRLDSLGTKIAEHGPEGQRIALSNLVRHFQDMRLRLTDTIDAAARSFHLIQVARGKADG